MKGKNLWKDIRAYDASDLEQWMEQSVSSRIWFANETGRPSDGVRTLERCWADWANVTDPYLHSSLLLLRSKRGIVRSSLSLRNATQSR